MLGVIQGLGFLLGLGLFPVERNTQLGHVAGVRGFVRVRVVSDWPQRGIGILLGSRLFPTDCNVHAYDFLRFDVGLRFH